MNAFAENNLILCAYSSTNFTDLSLRAKNLLISLRDIYYLCFIANDWQKSEENY